MICDFGVGVAQTRDLDGVLLLEVVDVGLEVALHDHLEVWWWQVFAFHHVFECWWKAFFSFFHGHRHLAGRWRHSRGRC